MELSIQSFESDGDVSFVADEDEETALYLVRKWQVGRKVDPCIVWADGEYDKHRNPEE